MQQASDAWIQNQKNNIITAESFVDVTLTVIDPDVQSAASASDNGHVDFATTSDTVKGIDYTPPRYATLETNLWKLDGSFPILPNNDRGVNGYIGNSLCGADGVFGTPPSLTIQLSKTSTTVLPGVSIVWGETYETEYAVDFTVTAFRGSTQVASKTVTGNTQLATVVEMNIQNYDKLVISVSKWCKPDRRARIQSVWLGLLERYSRSDLLNFQHNMSADPLSASLPKSEIVFEVKNHDGRFDPDNTEGMTPYLMERQTVTVRYGYRLNGAVEWIKGGTYYLSEWETPRNTLSATFAARDLLEFMNEKYTGPAGGTLHDIAAAALTQANLPKTMSGDGRWSLDSALQEISVPSGVDLSDYTIAEVLQLGANAGCCILAQDRDGFLQIKPMAYEATDYGISKDLEWGYPESSLSKQLRKISINDGAYQLSVGNTGETQELKNPLVSEERAAAVAQWAKDYLTCRKLISGEWRADPRVDCLDIVSVETPFSEHPTVLTELNLAYNGGFSGKYTGRVVETA